MDRKGWKKKGIGEWAFITSKKDIKGAKGIERDRTGLKGIERDRKGAERIERDRKRVGLYYIEEMGP
jgi:hypothetical protein